MDPCVELEYYGYIDIGNSGLSIAVLVPKGYPNLHWKMDFQPNFGSGRIKTYTPEKSLSIVPIFAYAFSHLISVWQNPHAYPLPKYICDDVPNKIEGEGEIHMHIIRQKLLGEDICIALGTRHGANNKQSMAYEIDMELLVQRNTKLYRIYNIANKCLTKNYLLVDPPTSCQNAIPRVG